jgi:hypothetical protein
MDSKSSASGHFDLVDTYDMCKIVKGSWAFNGVVGGVAFLLPLMVAAESHLQAGSGAAVVATAHVNFKIVIPQVLYLHVGDTGPVAIMSNGRSVAMTATARTPSATPAQGNAILSAAARKVISQDAVCAASAGAGPVVCTASLP